jgi:outer membrane murein-binding lipoprotein Lpp
MTISQVMRLGCALLLAGCVSPEKVQKTRMDAAQFDAELQARKSNAQCSETAMPGTPEHLACRLAKTGSGK